MNKPLIIGILLTGMLAVSILVGYSQNWFTQPNNSPSTTATSQPQTTNHPETTNQPEPTNQPAATPTAPTTTTAPTTPVTPTQPPASTQSPISTINMTLEVYGNANMDDAVDQNDITYTLNIINGIAATTRFADANNDGKIDQADVDQINHIIAGTARYILLLDGNGQLINVSLPKNRIVVEYIQNAELIRILGLESKVVGVDYCVNMLKSLYFPEYASQIVSVGQMYTPDYEAVLNLAPDILLTFSSATSEKASKLPGVDVVFLGLYYPNVTNPEDSRFLQGVLKAGYIFNKVTEARNYANWLLNLTKTISSRTSVLTEKPRVFMTNYPYDASTTVTAYATIDTLGQVCILAGGGNIASVLSGYPNASSFKVDSEWIIQQDPEYIFLHTVRYTFSGVMRADPAQGLDVDDPTSIRNCLNTYLARPEFAGVSAFKNGKVYIIAGDFRNNAMGGVLGAVYLAKILHPTLFVDLNPEAIHQEYITRFLRLNYNLNQHGVFLYPPLNINSNLVGIPDAYA
ncbi:MAG: ABC transporter substrate-binding protein [Candidatus Bathyarchaeia archaeon]